MNKDILDKIESAAYLYCESDQYPTGFSGYNSGAIFGYTEGFRLAIEFLKGSDAYETSYLHADILITEGQRLGILPKVEE